MPGHFGPIGEKASKDRTQFRSVWPGTSLPASLLEQTPSAASTVGTIDFLQGRGVAIQFSTEDGTRSCKRSQKLAAQ